MSVRDPVIIVGAGPAGLAVAAILAQAGVPSRVFEAEEKLPRDLRAGSIHPPTLEMLDTIGVAQDFLAIGIRVPRWQIRGREEGVIVEWDLSLLEGETPYPFRFHCEQFKLTPLLQARLRGARRHGALQRIASSMRPRIAEASPRASRRRAASRPCAAAISSAPTARAARCGIS